MKVQYFFSVRLNRSRTWLTIPDFVSAFLVLHLSFFIVTSIILWCKNFVGEILCKLKVYYFINSN